MINYKLVIGTANWFNDYNGTHVNYKQADAIVQYALDNGIREFDTAAGYAEGKAEKYLSEDPSVKIYTKGDDIDDYMRSRDLFGDRMIGWLVHHPNLNLPEYRRLQERVKCAFGFSVYSQGEHDLYRTEVKCDIFQMPYWQIGKYTSDAIIARKVFAKLKDGSTVKECLQDLLQVQFARAAVGVDNVNQLKEIVGIWGEL
jgi:hypothetical protein